MVRISLQVNVLWASRGLGYTEIGMIGVAGGGGKNDLVRALALSVFVDAISISLGVDMVFRIWCWSNW